MAGNNLFLAPPWGDGYTKYRLGLNPIHEENWFNKLQKAEDAEVDMIDMAYEPKKNSRLSCQIIVSDELEGLEVTTPEKQS